VEGEQAEDQGEVAHSVLRQRGGGKLIEQLLHSDAVELQGNNDGRLEERSRAPMVRLVSTEASQRSLGRHRQARTGTRVGYPREVPNDG
jgi:hypothetical protein